MMEQDEQDLPQRNGMHPQGRRIFIQLKVKQHLPLFEHWPQEHGNLVQLSGQVAQALGGIGSQPTQRFRHVGGRFGGSIPCSRDHVRRPATTSVVLLPEI